MALYEGSLASAGEGIEEVGGVGTPPAAGAEGVAGVGFTFSIIIDSDVFASSLVEVAELVPCCVELGGGELRSGSC